MSIVALPCPKCGGPKSYRATTCQKCREYPKTSFEEAWNDPVVRSHFWERIRVDESTGCWNWTGAKSKAGYGSVGIGFRVFNAHRVAFEFSTGKSADGLFVCHRCDNRACINPAHLFLGTPEDNATDMAEKGRVNTQKLTAENVREIRAIYARGGITQKELAKQFGMGQSQIARIVLRQTWRFVD